MESCDGIILNLEVLIKEHWQEETEKFKDQEQSNITTNLDFLIHFSKQKKNFQEVF